VGSADPQTVGDVEEKRTIIPPNVGEESSPSPEKKVRIRKAYPASDGVGSFNNPVTGSISKLPPGND
jgi:hypothetical protein